MVFYSINELYVGLKVVYHGYPCVIIDNECVKPGKGQSFSRIRFRQIISGKILEKTFKSGDYLEVADVVEIDLIYMYSDGEFWYFMDEKNFEQITLSLKVIKENTKWMVEQLNYTITLWNKIPILVTPPNFIALKVIKTDPVVSRGSGNVTSAGTKLAIVSTGAVIKVPIFIQLDECIKINTRTGEYASRVK